MNHKEVREEFIIGINVDDDGFGFTSSIDTAIISAESELHNMEETIKTLESLKPNCDRLDYALAASSGVLCGIIDIFLVGKPGESPVGDLTDKWFATRVTDFAKLCGWESRGTDSLSSAIRFLEQKFNIPYDQHGAGDAGNPVYDLTPSNHHFKSLGHNPTVLGLFFSIFNQFYKESHFVSGGDLMSLGVDGGEFELRGDSFMAKIFYGFSNWFGHLISDMSGSSSSNGRGMGIPSPLWTWMNDVIAIKRGLKIPASQFDKTINDLALTIYKKGYDIRFQATQVIPVVINEMIVRLIYATRRLVKYFITTQKEEYSQTDIWKACEPFSNPSVKRMLTVAHGTFCIMDLGDATIWAFIKGGGNFNGIEFFLRLNIVGVGRFTISLYGEAKQAFVISKANSEVQFSRKEIIILEDYLRGLLFLSNLYNDKSLVDFVDDFKKSDMYVKAFQKSTQLAELRMVPENKILRVKNDIDLYFGGDNRQ